MLLSNVPSSVLHQADHRHGSSDLAPIGQAAPQSRHGSFRVVLGDGFARDTVVVRYGGVELARRCGVSTRPDGNAGVIVAEVPVGGGFEGAADHHLTIEVVGRLMSGSMQLSPPTAGEVTVKANLDRLNLHLTLV